MPKPDPAQKDRIAIQVCYASPELLSLIDLQVNLTTTLIEAIQLSCIVDRHPEINVHTSKFGIFGKLRPPDALVQAGDRVEIYRPLLVDPMEARRRRAKKAQQP